MPDWKRTDVTHQLEAVMISQTNFSENLGLLEGVVWEQSTLEAAYYTDLRTSGKLRVCGEGWRRGSFIRIVHNIPEFGYRKTLGTYIVTDDSAEYKNGKWFYDLTLQSTLAMIAEDRFVKPYPIDKGTKAVDAMKAVLQNSGAHSMRTAFGNFSGAEAKSQVAIDDSLADDVRATKAQVLEAGKSRLEAFFALSSMSNNRIDVTPEGYIRVTRYTPPANKSATWTFDLREDRGTVVNGSLSRSSDWLSIPDTVAVRHDYSTDEKTGEMFFEDWKEKRELLPLISYLKTDAAEAEILTGLTDRAEAAKLLHRWGAKEVLITHNTEVLAYDGSEIYTCPIRARNLSGRTGRGDTTFAAYLTERLHADVPTALRVATATVSLKMETPGPFRGTRADVEAYIGAFYR